MRLYFHLLNGTETIRDEEGIEVTDLDTAKAEALNAIRDMQGEQKPHDWASWSLAVADESGAQLFLFDVGAQT